MHADEPVSVDSPLRTRLTYVRRAARDPSPIEGLTHCYYRYPARFSPVFAAAAIEAFSSRDDVVLDPFMGGGTTVLEALVRGRHAVGCDLNSLSAFVTRVKTTPLLEFERAALVSWADHQVPRLLYDVVIPDLDEIICSRRTYNLSIPFARPIKKLIALALRTLETLPTPTAAAFARCALLNTGQWALNGRKRQTPLSEFRSRLRETLHEMLDGDRALRLRLLGNDHRDPILITGNAAHLAQLYPFSMRMRADLVVTSPPYPGIHMLYHRWQVDGRRETAAPYWIASCNDGQGNAYYNFADRQVGSEQRYFEHSLCTLHGIRAVLRRGGILVQLLSFRSPRTQLPRFLTNMCVAGFEEISPNRHSASHRRLWRSVPGRRWHANYKGNLYSSREVLLVHQAI